MLEHQKLMIRSVSSNPELFRKEVEKSFKWLAYNEILHLYEWLKTQYGTTYGSDIDEIFKKYAA